MFTRPCPTCVGHHTRHWCWSTEGSWRRSRQNHRESLNQKRSELGLIFFNFASVVPNCCVVIHALGAGFDLVLPVKHAASYRTGSTGKSVTYDFAIVWYLICGLTMSHMCRLPPHKTLNLLLISWRATEVKRTKPVGKREWSQLRKEWVC